MDENSVQILWCDYFYCLFLMFTKNIISIPVLGIHPVLVNCGWLMKSGLLIWQMNVHAQQTFSTDN